MRGSFDPQRTFEGRRVDPARWESDGQVVRHHFQDYVVRGLSNRPRRVAQHQTEQRQHHERNNSQARWTVSPGHEGDGHERRQTSRHGARQRRQHLPEGPWPPEPNRCTVSHGVPSSLSSSDTAVGCPGCCLSLRPGLTECGCLSICHRRTSRPERSFRSGGPLCRRPCRCSWRATPAEGSSGWWRDRSSHCLFRLPRYGRAEAVGRWVPAWCIRFDELPYSSPWAQPDQGQATCPPVNPMPTNRRDWTSRIGCPDWVTRRQVGTEAVAKERIP